MPTYLSDLRELNELNFARFDAKLEQRLAQFELQVEQRMEALEARMERRARARWLFAAWASLMIPIMGLWFRG